MSLNNLISSFISQDFGIESSESYFFAGRQLFTEVSFENINLG